MLGAEEAGDPELGEAIGFVLGWHSSRATRELAEAAKQWKRLKRLAKPWK
jgi:hypothetical protein